MRPASRLQSLTALVAGLVLGIHASSATFAQVNGGGGGGGGGNQGGGNQAGILIEPDGLVRSQIVEGLSAKLALERRAAFAEKLPTDLQVFSEKRMISLIRLEEVCRRQLEEAGDVSDEVRYLAGLQRIDYLFIDEDSADIVIAGPAEGFVPDVTGRMIGLTTGRPTLRLDDLIVALKAAFTGGGAIGCSIDPEPGRLARMQQYIRQNSSPTTPAGAARRYQQMARLLGRQNVSVFGVDPETHFAQALVEADFRMKRISLGTEPSGVRGLRSHLSMLRPNGNSIQRWWFVPLYDGLYTTDEGSAFHLAGQRVQLLAQEEISNAQGQRSDAAFTRASTQQFAKLFTAKYTELAERSPIFAELQNLFDLAIVTALLRTGDIPQRVGWTMALFADPPESLVPTYTVPQQVESETTYRRASRGMILGLVGGVTIRPQQVLDHVQVIADPALRLDGIRAEVVSRPRSEEHPWWWD